MTTRSPGGKQPGSMRSGTGNGVSDRDLERLLDAASEPPPLAQAHHTRLKASILGRIEQPPQKQVVKGESRQSEKEGATLVAFPAGRRPGQTKPGLSPGVTEQAWRSNAHAPGLRAQVPAAALLAASLVLGVVTGATGFDTALVGDVVASLSTPASSGAEFAEDLLSLGDGEDALL